MIDEAPRTPTISDVAALAGVSIATVSKALNGRAQVHADTRRRVLRAAEELSYRPNPLARGLPTGQTRTVGLLTSDSVGRFSIPVLLGAEDAFGAGEMSVLLCDARGDAIREQHYLRTLLARRVDGLIIVGQNTDPRRSISRDLPVPVVYAYARSDDPDDLSFGTDDRQGAELAVGHLVELGRRRIAHLTGPESYLAARDRVDGLYGVLAGAGLPLRGGGVRYGEWTQRWGRQATEMLLLADPDVDAVFCGSDQIAAGAVEVLREHGRRIPDDVAVVGFDNWEVFATETRPPLTTVDMNLEQLGRIAARHLFAAIDGDPLTGVHLLPCRLVIRESAAPG